MSDLEWRAPKKPLIYSSYSADRQAEELLELAQVKRLQDADGGIWRTETTEDLEPSLVKPEQMQRRLKIHHVISLNKQFLLEQKVCDAKLDARLLELLDDRQFECRLSSKPLHGDGNDEMRLRVSRYFEYFRARLKEEGFRKEKRQALERWLDRTLQFGGRKSSV